MADIATVIAELVTQLTNDVTGLRRVPDAPPETIDQFPFAVVYPSNGTYNTHTPEDMIGLHNINVEVHVSRKDLPRDFTSLLDLQDDIPSSLLSGLKDGDYSQLTTFGEISYTFGPLEWAGVPTLGVTYTISGVKVKADL